MDGAIGGLFFRGFVMANDQATIEALVRKVVMRTLGVAPGHSPGSGRLLLDETALRDTPTGATLDVPPGAIITPLARQAAQERHITLRVGAASPAAAGVGQPGARRVASGDVWRGIVIDGAGIGSCMAANKISGVRAAMCYDQATAVNSREHNNANVLTLGAGLIGPALAQLIVKTWLATEFGGGRHAARVAKIDALDGARPAVAPSAAPTGDAAKVTASPPAY